MDLKLQARNYTELNRKDILRILIDNIICAKIETGFRVWLHSFISLPINHPMEKKYGYGICGYLRELTYKSTISCYPFEMDYPNCETRIRTVASELFKMHKDLLV